MSERKRRTEENIEDVQRISDIVDRRIKKSNAELGAPSLLKKNNYLDSKGGLHMIDKFPGIDFNSYEKERIRKEKAKR